MIRLHSCFNDRNEGYIRAYRSNGYDEFGDAFSDEYDDEFEPDRSW